MSVPVALFYAFAALAVVSALGMVLNVRNTVASAMSLVVTMIALAGIYLLLEAHLVAAIQIMVYAGAIVVLFLFVVMLLNLRHDAFAPGRQWLVKTGALLLALVALAELLRLLRGRAARAAAAARGLRRLPPGRHRALHRLRAAGRDGLAAPARGDRRRADPRQAEDRLMLPLEHVIGLSAILFVIGMIGVATRRNLIVVLMSIELMLNAVNLAFVGFNRVWPGTAEAPALDGQIFVLMVITVAAAEVAVGLGIVISLFRNRDSVDLEEVSLLKW